MSKNKGNDKHKRPVCPGCNETVYAGFQDKEGLCPICRALKDNPDLSEWTLEDEEFKHDYSYIKDVVKEIKPANVYEKGKEIYKKSKVEDKPKVNSEPKTLIEGTYKGHNGGILLAMKTVKARVDLVPPEAIYGMAMAFEDGAVKRSAYNWEVGSSSKEWSLVDRLEAAMRHTLEMMRGKDIADDSKIHHAAHLMANAAMIYTMYVRGNIGKDDRRRK